MICEASPLFVGMAGAPSLVGELRKGLFLAWSCWKNMNICNTDIHTYFSSQEQMATPTATREMIFIFI